MYQWDDCSQFYHTSLVPYIDGEKPKRIEQPHVQKATIRSRRRNHRQGIKSQAASLILFIAHLNSSFVTTSKGI